MSFAAPMPKGPVRPVLRVTARAPETAPETAEAPVLASAAPSVPVADARRLTGPDGTGRIVLDGQVYTLRITRAGKLILTK